MKDLLKFARLGSQEKAEWLSAAASSVEFLKKSYMGSRVILYASVDAVLVHAVLVDQEKVTPADHEDLQRSYFSASDHWVLEHVSGGGQPERMYLQGPMDSPGCETLVGAEQLVFRRKMDGVDNRPAYTEINQKLTQALDLHFIEERSAYCRVDKNGDIESVITLEDFPAVAGGFPGHLVTIDAEAITEFMAVTGTALAVKFDFTRTDGGNFRGWDGVVRSTFDAADLFYNLGVLDGHASFANGWIIIRPSMTVEGVIASRNAASDTSTRRYADFKFWDFRHGTISSGSCSPSATTNYFEQKEGLPFELSPVFFRAEVLSKYKADPDKYHLEPRALTCRNAWYLRSYDINAEGQVHTYLGDLARLPYEEQLYWQSFNELPKGPISKRSYESDFLGEWSSEVDSLDEIRRIVSELDAEAPGWWSIRGASAAAVAHYPSRENAAEWGDEVLHLDQLVVEGFVPKAIKAIATKAGATFEPEWGSLKVIEVCFVVDGKSAAEAASLVSPLRELHALRNTLSAHSAGASRIEAQRSAIRDHGSYRAHFELLAERCIEALKSILALLRKLA